MNNTDSIKNLKNNSLAQQLISNKIIKTNTNTNDILTITLHVKRDKHENGMTLKEYTDAVIAKTHPILDHDMFVYQFGSIQDEIDLVVSWANTNNLVVKDSCCGKATIKVEGKVSQFNKLFNITLKTAKDNDRTYIMHEGNYSLPNEINDVVEKILGLDNTGTFKNFARIGHSTINSNIVVNAGSNLSNPSPTDLASAYNFPKGSGTNNDQGAGECIGIIELGGGYTRTVVDLSLQRVGISKQLEVVDVLVGNGVNNPSDIGPSCEVMLDIYCAGAVAPSAKQVIYFAENSFDAFANAILEAGNDTVNNPSVLSISWAAAHWVIEHYDLMYTFESAIQVCVVKGITVLVSSGDWGISPGPPGTFQGVFCVNYPSASPYVLACGGTEVTIDTNYNITSEIVWGTNHDYDPSSGGGSAISLFRNPGVYPGFGPDDATRSTINYFGFDYQGIPIPDWQVGLKENICDPIGLWNAKVTDNKSFPILARSIPDVSAMAINYNYYIDYYGEPYYLEGVQGTSAVAPLLAGLIARINSISGIRVGFANEIWYNNPSAFNDITIGNNIGAWSYGYNATPGWDSCTGLGSPIGESLLALQVPFNGTINYPNLLSDTRPSTGLTYPRPTNRFNVA